MRRFSLKMASKAPVVFLPATEVVGATGGVKSVYPAVGSGTVVVASVQPRTIRRVEPDGTIISATIHVVHLFDDPSSLNAGRGVKQNDAFGWNGLTLVCQGDISQAWESGTWRAECLSVA